MLRLLDCKEDMHNEAVLNAPSILNSLSEESKNHFEAVKELLELKGISYKVNDKIVRGLDYYTGTVFEVIADDIEGPSKVICGGGRYNNLVESLGGKDVPAVGFGMGLERVLMLLEEFNIDVPAQPTVDCYIAKIGLDNNLIDVKLANLLRESEVSCEVDLVGRSIKAGFKYADKIGAKLVLIVGEEELKNNSVNVKNMVAGKEETILMSELVTYVKKEL